MTQSSPKFVGEVVSKRRVRRRTLSGFRISLVVLLVCTTLVISREFWWPCAFQAMARTALLKHENDTALQWLKWATVLAPETGETAFLRARAYRHIGQMEQSATALKRAHLLRIPLERLRREQWLAQAQSGQLREAERHLSSMLMDPQGDTDEICEAYVLGYLRTQRQAQALQILESWMGDYPTRARPYILRGKIWEFKSEFNKAAQDLRRAILLEPENAEASFQLALALQQGNQCDQAQPLFEKNLKVPQFASQSHVGLARCLKSNGDHERVRQLLEKALKLAPDNTQALCELGRLDLEAGNYSSATSSFQEAVRTAPRDEEIHYLLAQTLKADGKSEEAQPHFDFVLRFREAFQELAMHEDRLSKNPLDVESLVRAGAILLEIADPEDGVVRLLSALEINPKHAEARRLLAAHYDHRAETRPEFRTLADGFRDVPE